MNALRLLPSSRELVWLRPRQLFDASANMGQMGEDTITPASVQGGILANASNAKNARMLKSRK